MADESSKPPAPPAMTPDEVALLLRHAWEKAGVSPKCELCGSSEWKGIATGQYDSVGIWLRLTNATVTMDSPIYAAYGAECVKCGNVRIHGKGQVDGLTGRTDGRP